MPPEAFALVVASALLHAIWNAMVKRGDDPDVLLFGMMCFGSLVTLPWLIAALGSTPPQVLLYALPSGLVEAYYVVALSAAYARYDFSLVYPVARGSAPAWLVAIAALTLHERPTPVALAGIAAIVVGIYVVSLRTLADPLRPWRERGAWLSLSVGLAIAIYSAIDKAGVAIAAPLAYASLIYGATALWLLPVLVPRRGIAGSLTAFRKTWRTSAVVGLFSAATYGLVLWAFSLAPASYVGSVREISVVFAALIGWRRLREPLGVARTVAASLVAVGAILVGLG